MAKFRFAKDRWTSKQGIIIYYDKAEHLVCWYILYIVLLFIFHDQFWATAVGFILGILWEVKDALMPYERYKFWGGDGFSWKDLVADCAGLIWGILTVW